MKINSIELEGFQSYREKEKVTLDGISLAAVIGPNHVGKSTLIADALMYALYGASRGALVNDIVTRGQAKATVTVEFTVRGTPYKITRIRTRKGRSEAAVYVQDDTYTGGWRDLSEKNPASADSILANLIGMNAETAKLTWMISQGDFGAFCDMKPAPRRAALADAFGLSQYGQLLTVAEQRRRDLQGKLTLKSTERDRISARLDDLNEAGPYPQYDDDELDKAAEAAEKKAEKAAAALANTNTEAADERLRDAQANLAAFDKAQQQSQTQHAQHVARLDNSIRQADAAVREAQRGVEAISAAETELVQARAGIDEITAQGKQAKDTLDEARSRHADAASQPPVLIQRLAAIKERGQEVTEQIETLRNGVEQGQGTCWTCGQGLSADDARILIDAKTQQRTQLGQEWRTTNDQLQQAQRNVATLTGEIQTAESQLERLRQQVQQEQSRAARAEQIVSTREQATMRVQQAAAQLRAAQDEREQAGEAPTVDTEQRSRLAAAVTSAQESVEAARASESRRAEFETAVHTAREESRLLWQEKQRRTSTAKELATLRPQAETLRTEITALEEGVADHDVLVEAFKPSGIPSMILAGVVEELNEDANETLGFLGDDNLGVRISTQHEKARGGVDEKVMIYAVTADGEADYRTLSGSEKFRLALAVRIGLAQCIARRTGTPVETIVMDEGWGALDEDTKLAVQDVLTRLSRTFNVYTVSHIDDVRSAFPTVLEVSADTGTSRCLVRTAA